MGPRREFLLTIFCLSLPLFATCLENETAHEHGFELALAVDITEPDFLTILVQKEAHSGEEGDHDDHDHRRLLSGEEEGEEPEYPFDHNVLLVQMVTGACTADSIEDLEPQVEEILMNATSVYTELESAETPVNITFGSGMLQLELHPATFTAISQFHFQVSEMGCLLIFSEHFLEGDFLQNSHGEPVQASFQEPAPSEINRVAYSAEVWTTALGATLLVCVISLVGVLLLLCGFRKGSDFIEEYEGEIMALVFGVLLAVVLIHLLPEASELYGPFDWEFGVIVLASILAAFLVKLKFGHDHVGNSPRTQTEEADEKGKGANDEPTQYSDAAKSRAWNILWGDVFHNLSDGVLIATAFGACASDTTLGWIVTGSIVLHEIPQELADFTILYRYFDSEWFALGANLLSSLSALLGAILVLSLGYINGKDQAVLLAVNIGVLLFICLGEIAPSLTETTDTTRRFTRAGIAVIGFVIIGLLELAPHTHCEVTESGEANQHNHP